jgi:hypothetical protein
MNVTVQPICGGLGNQMFKIAAMLGYSKKFGHKPILFKQIRVGLEPHSKKVYWDTVFKNVITVIPQGGIEWSLYKEPAFNYIPTPKKPHIKLYGYFQSALYFDHCREYICKSFTNEIYKQKARGAINKLSLNRDLLLISIHVRRGDYKRLSLIHTLLSKNYYQCAIEHFGEANYLVFSDDKQWIEKNIEVSNRYIINQDEIIEMYMMSLCDHNIIANSSFSWWGAYLNENPQKQVIAPKNWFGPRGPKKWDSIYMPNWILL